MIRKIIISVALLLALSLRVYSFDGYLSGTVGPQFPTGDFHKNGFPVGFGFYLSYDYLVTDQISLYASTGYLRWKGDFSQSEGGVTIDQYLIYTDVPLVFGGKYHIFDDFDDINFFIGGDLGVRFTTSSWDRDMPDLGDLPIQIDTYENFSEAHFGISGMIGATYPIDENFGLTGNLKYTVLFGKSTCPEDYGETTTLTYFGINLGATYFVN